MDQGGESIHRINKLSMYPEAIFSSGGWNKRGQVSKFSKNNKHGSSSIRQLTFPRQCGMNLSQLLKSLYL